MSYVWSYENTTLNNIFTSLCTYRRCYNLIHFYLVVDHYRTYKNHAFSTGFLIQGSIKNSHKFNSCISVQIGLFLFLLIYDTGIYGSKHDVINITKYGVIACALSILPWVQFLYHCWKHEAHFNLHHVEFATFINILVKQQTFKVQNSSFPANKSYPYLEMGGII